MRDRDPETQRAFQHTSVTNKDKQRTEFSFAVHHHRLVFSNICGLLRAFESTGLTLMLFLFVDDLNTVEGVKLIAGNIHV
jgi:hypothetical protein